MQWLGYPTHSWEPQWELLGNETKEGTARDAVLEFWEAREVPGWEPPPKGGDCWPHCPGGDTQCQFCCWWSCAAGVKVHEARCTQRPKQRGTASLAAKALRRQREKRHTGRLPAVHCPKRVNGEWQDAVLATVSSFLYLGSMVQGGHRGTSEIEHRIDLGNAALHKHWKFWGNKRASLKHKLSSYRIYVTTVLMHGYESWHLDEKSS